MTTNTTRRAVMAGLAAAPVAGLPAIAGAVAGDDPILAAFAEIERTRAAYEQIGDDPSDAVLDAVCADICDAEVSLYSTKPTTAAGAARLLRFVADYFDEDDQLQDTYLTDVIGGAIRNAADVLEREPQS
jgi:hypothetical protein